MAGEAISYDGDPTQLWELQKQIKLLQTQCGKITSQLHKLQIEMKRNKVATNAVSESPDGAKVYKAVARAFILRPKDALVEELEQKLKDNLKETKNLQELEKQFVTRLTSATAKLGDLQKAIKLSEPQS